MHPTQRPSRSPVVAVGAWLVVAALATLGCSGDEPGPESDAATTVTRSAENVPADDGLAGVEVSVHQPRYLQGRPRLAIAVTNARAVPIVVQQLALRAEHFEPLAPEPKGSTITPGSRTDLQIDVGDTVCDDPGPLTATVDLELTVDGAAAWHTVDVGTELLSTGSATPSAPSVPSPTPSRSASATIPP